MLCKRGSPVPFSDVNFVNLHGHFALFGFVRAYLAAYAADGLYTPEAGAKTHRLVCQYLILTLFIHKREREVISCLCERCTPFNATLPQTGCALQQAQLSRKSRTMCLPFTRCLQGFGGVFPRGKQETSTNR